MATQREAKKQPGISSTDAFEQYHGAILRYIGRLVGDPDESEDLTQETFLRAHRQLPSLQDPAALKAWLYRIATHVSYDRLRQTARYRARFAPQAGTDGEPAEARWVDTASPRIDDAFERTEMSTCVQEFIAQLNDDSRAVILLHDVEGLTHPEIAALLGSSLAAVKIRLHRARQKLRAALKEGCEFEQDDRGVLVCDRKPPS